MDPRDLEYHSIYSPQQSDSPGKLTSAAWRSVGLLGDLQALPEVISNKKPLQ